MTPPTLNMNGKNALATFVAMILIGVGIFYFTQHYSATSTNGTGDENPSNGSSSAARGMSIEQYVTQNISELSPVKEQLGGTFYVTEIEAEAGTGTVHYEDGHNAYEADFTYTIDEEHGGITMISFVVRD